MITKSKNLLTPDLTSFLLDLYRTLPNRVSIENQIRDRHYPSAIGHFMVSEFSKDEFEPYWKHIEPRLNHRLELIYARVLKYNVGCYIEPHLDTYNSTTQTQSDVSLIIQLNDPNEYEGGDMVINNRKQKLNIGDAVYYTYDAEHGVTPVTKGIRYVANLRLKTVK